MPCRLWNSIKNICPLICMTWSMCFLIRCITKLFKPLWKIREHFFFIDEKIAFCGSKLAVFPIENPLRYGLGYSHFHPAIGQKNGVVTWIALCPQALWFRRDVLNGPHFPLLIGSGFFVILKQPSLRQLVLLIATRLTVFGNGLVINSFSL